MPVPERRKVNAEDIEPEVKVFPEFSLLAQPAKVLVRGGQHPSLEAFFLG